MYKRIYIVVIAAAIFTGLVNCRTSQNSDVKDVGLSPQDLTAASPVIWQDASNYVHYGLCPVGSASVNRSCQGLVEKFFPLTYSAFSKDLIDSIVAARPQGANVPVSQKLADITDKIKRLNDKINAGGLTATATANFKAQIEQLEKEQSDPNLQLTADELKLYEKITLGLQAGKDIAIDEGEATYELSKLPFTGPNSKAIVNNCLTGGKAVGPACWYRGGNNESCTSVCSKINVAPDPETINFAGSGGSIANCYEVGKAFGAGQGNQVTGNPVGCILSGNQTYWFNSPTTDYDTGTYERLCACK
jgi:hypothetical protein